MNYSFRKVSSNKRYTGALAVAYCQRAGTRNQLLANINIGEPLRGRGRVILQDRRGAKSVDLIVVAVMAPPSFFAR